MKRLLIIGQALLLGITLLTFSIAILNVCGVSLLKKFNHSDPIYNNKEDFDPGLSRLNSVEKLTEFCDSLYSSATVTKASEFQKDYTNLVASVIRKRFYHGYSHYGFHDNYLAATVSRFTVHGYSAIVVPDKILKYPFGACSQQAIVMMEVLKGKGMKTRQVSFHGKTSGHFSFEVFYNGDWHFYDTNLEPDINVLNSHDRPGIVWLTTHPDVLKQAYNKHSAEEILDVFSVYRFGEVNKFPAPNAIIFQKVTLFLSYSAWFFSGLAFLFFRRKYRRYILKYNVRNRRVHFPQPQTGTSPAYYPRVTASGS